MTANDSKSYFSYLNKLVDQYNNIYIILLVKNLLFYCSSLTVQIETNPRATKFKVYDRVRVTKYKNVFS